MSIMEGRVMTSDEALAAIDEILALDGYEADWSAIRQY